MTRNLSTAEAATCLTQNPAMEEGPYFIDEKQNQSGGTCGPLAVAYVDL
jgi:hypothetical protein